MTDPFPEQITPQLATLYADAPTGGDWIHEIKFDGYRILARKEGDRVRLFTRNGHDWTDKFPTIEAGIRHAVGAERAYLDGEVVVVTPEGRTDFGALQAYVAERRGNPVFFAFDLMYLDGRDLRDRPQAERKERLRGLLGESETVFFSAHFEGRGPQVFEAACAQGMEGIISKQADAPYRSARTKVWRKIKCIQRQEFVIGGYTDPGGTRTAFGALALGYHDENGDLIYCGRVGTGFDEATLDKIIRLLQPAEESPFANKIPRPEAKGLHYVRPDHVCEVEFMNWTDDGRLRHPSFKGLRSDKAPASITRESPVRQEDPNTIAGITISHPDRVVDEPSGVTKREFARYLADVADWILPHVAGRPLALVRCPEGNKGECFFQKNFSDALPDALVPIDLGDAKGIGVEDETGLVALAQFGVMEIHPWGSRAGDVERPDRLVFDLDPGPDLGWEEVVRGARDIRKVLEAIGLESWVKTSGGKGLHVCVPIKPELDWDTVKEFCHGIAILLEEREPDRYISVMAKAKRSKKIFVDYLRNGRGATSVAAFSPRARANVPVSMPIRWEELGKIGSAADFTVRNALERLRKQRKDPWEGFIEAEQNLAGVLGKR